MCQPVVTPLTFHDISNSDCRWGVAAAALKFEVVRVFSTLDIAIPGDDLRAERFNSAIVADKLSRLSVVRKTNGTTFSAEICLPFEPSKVFFYFGDANSSKKTKTFFTRMSSTSCCCRVSAGDAFADWDTAKQTSWTLRRRPRSWNFHAVLTNRSEKEGKTSANSIIIIIMLSSCFMFLQCIRRICAFYGWRRWQSVTLVYSCHTFCWRCLCNWHCGRPPSRKTPSCALSALL